VAQLKTEDALLHVEVDGAGDPITVLAHGITNSCRELAMMTPLFAGTKIRFCFRGHGHSSSPERGYKFADFGRDLSAVADAYGAQNAVGTSLGACALCNLLADQPDRFRRLIMLLPAGLDRPFDYKDRMLRTVDMVDGKSKEEAIATLLADPERIAGYVQQPYLRELDEINLQDINLVGVPRAIREVIQDIPLLDRAVMRRVTAPTLLICREGDIIHPAWVGRALAEVMPNAELMMYEDGAQMYQAIPEIVGRVREYLAS